jgi:pilus assembly protein CpaE
MIRVLIASPDPELIDRADALFEESGDVEVVSTAATANAVTATLSGGDEQPDVVVLHEDLGPLPVLDLARDLNHRFPDVGVVLIARDPSMDLLRSSMSAGVRSVIRFPLTLAELHGAVLEANEWAQTVQARLASSGGDGRKASLRGRMVALAGSKGGVGTTTIATQLALEMARRDPNQSVCLIDLDLQTGDVRAFLDVSHRRSITDLIEVASELTTGHLTDAMFLHHTGLRILMPPVHGEDAEDLDGATTARILGGIRSRFDTVVIDCGSVTSVASAVAVELADEVLVVCTPDVVSLRATNRLLQLWERLSVRTEGIRAILNRANKSREVQPSLAKRVVKAPFLDTVIPERDKDIEAATNAGDPSRLVGAVRDAMTELSKELLDEPTRTKVDPKEDAAAREGRLEQRVTAESGALSVEFVGLLLPIGAVILTVWQVVLAGYTLLLANHAANAGARALAVDSDIVAVQQAARDDLHGHWHHRAHIVPVGNQVRVTIPVPLIVPGQSSPWRITTTAGTVLEPQSLAPPTVTTSEDAVAVEGWR